MTELVHILKIVDDTGRLVNISWDFATPELKKTILAALQRLLAKDTIGIAPVRFSELDYPTTFFFKLLRPLTEHHAADALIRALAKQYDFQTQEVTMTEQAYEDMVLRTLFGEIPDFPPD